MNPALERLSLRLNGQSCMGVPGQPAFRCQADDVAFQRLVSQYAFAFAPDGMYTGRTTGVGGFHLSVSAAYTGIDNGADYWKRGTRGATDPSTGASSQTGDPVSVLQLYSAKLRKSLGFGFELGGIIGFMPQTSLIDGGADLRFSVMEGFRLGVGGILPDIAVGAGVRTITGTPELSLTTVSLDGVVSKPLPIADRAVLTPWIGVQYLFIFGDSGLVDLTPNTDPVGYCDYVGPNQPGTPGATPDDYNGQPICKDGGSPADFNNNVVFQEARQRRWRMLLGLGYRYEMLVLGGQFLFDLIPPEDTQVNDFATEALQGTGRQYSFVLDVGAQF